jgi:TolB protein
MKTTLRNSLLGILLWAATPGIHAAEEGQITHYNENMTGAKPIPVTLSGFSGEVDSVLRTDLYIVGFEFVTGDKAAQYNISGSNNGHVEGHVNDAVNKSSLLAKRYNGSSLRTEAHAFANDIVLAITKQPAIFNGKVAFRKGEGFSSEIAAGDFDGHRASVLTSDKTLVNSPCWIPGQRRVLYATWRSGVPQIYEHDLNTGARKILAGHPGSNMMPAVSPDGRRVAMILDKSGSPDLYVCNIDGSNLKRLTQTREGESSPCWSPDSREICFAGGDGRPALYRISADGGAARKISTVGVGTKLTEPDWSPDGKTIVFTSATGGFSICVVPVEGGEAKVIVNGEDPCWAPNSRTVVFTRRQGDRRILSLLDVPTKHVKDVTHISGSCSQPSWAR